MFQKYKIGQQKWKLKQLKKAKTLERKMKLFSLFSLVSGHSWIACTDYAEKNAAVRTLFEIKK